MHAVHHGDFWVDQGYRGGQSQPAHENVLGLKSHVFEDFEQFKFIKLWNANTF